MVKDNRRFVPLVFFLIALLVTVLSVFLLILPGATFSKIPLSQEIISGIVLMLLSMGIFVLPAAGVFWAILAIFRFKLLILPLFEIALNLAIPVTVLSFDLFY